MKLYAYFLFLLLTLGMSSCATQQVAYFQDLQSGMEEEILNVKDICVMPNDKVSIVVNSKDPALTSLFNLPHVSLQLGKHSGQYTGGIQGLSCYTIDKEGYVDFPVLGKVYLAGMNREEIATHIKEELVRNDLVKNPVVTVEFMNLTVSVLGEVKSPGRVGIDRDRITIIDAITMAGDLTIQGRRDNVLVQREEGNKRKIYRVNLNEGSSLFNSPVYYLQQNDVVYVEPNDKRSRDTTVNGNTLRSVGFWMGLSSLVVSLTSLLLYAR